MADPVIKQLAPILLAGALGYARRGWRCIPLHFARDYGATPTCSCLKRKTCRTVGKHPTISDWRRVATTDEDLIRAWWRTWPIGNIGVLMGGTARLLALDIDGAAGRESLAKLEEQFSVLPTTLTQTTGRGDSGQHLIFTVPTALGDVDYVRNRVKIADGIDLRSEGGLIVAAPSVHSTGASYRWINPSQPVADLPEWFFKLATSTKARQSVAENGERPAEEDLPEVKERLRLAKIALDREPPAISGYGGSRACLRAAILLIRGYCLTPEQAFDLLWAAYNPRCVPPWSPDELMHKIASAEQDVDIPWRYKISTVGGSIVDAIIKAGKE